MSVRGLTMSCFGTNPATSEETAFDLELSDEDAPLKSPKKKGNGRRALSAEADISNGVTIQTSHMHLETRVALLAQVAEAKPHCGDGGQDRAVLPHRSLDHRHVLE